MYNGYRLLAVDGSDLLFIADPSDPDSYYSGENGQKPYSILHLNALFDLRQKVYVDAIVQKSRLANEHRSLCDMVDRSSIDKAILLAVVMYIAIKKFDKHPIVYILASAVIGILFQF